MYDVHGEFFNFFDVKSINKQDGLVANACGQSCKLRKDQIKADQYVLPNLEIFVF